MNPSKHMAALRDEVEAASLAQLQRYGLGGFSKNAVAKRFHGRGASPATVYRWVDAALKAGVPGQYLAKLVERLEVLPLRRLPPEDRRIAAIQAATAMMDAATRLLAEVRAMEAEGAS